MLLPNRYQGPVITSVSDMPLRMVDIVALILIFAGTVFLYSSLFTCLRSQLKMIKEHDSDTTENKGE